MNNFKNYLTLVLQPSKSYFKNIWPRNSSYQVKSVFNRSPSASSKLFPVQRTRSVIPIILPLSITSSFQPMNRKMVVLDAVRHLDSVCLWMKVMLASSIPYAAHKYKFFGSFADSVNVIENVSNETKGFASLAKDACCTQPFGFILNAVRDLELTLPSIAEEEYLESSINLEH